MEEEVGLVNIEVAFVKTDPELIKKLFLRLQKEKPESYTDEKHVKSLMRYNVWSVKQFADVSGLAVSTITNLSRPYYTDVKKLETRLDYCYPYPDSEGKGPKFIVRNDKSEHYIKL
jgi:hypothetical protein